MKRLIGRLKHAENIGVVVLGGTNTFGQINLNSQSKRSQIENNLLKKVKIEVNDRLTRSLHSQLIPLDMEFHPSKVTRPWDADIIIRFKDSDALNIGTSIFDVFNRDDICGRLLILGQPGAGKTTTQVELAEKLINQHVEIDSKYPIPVLINLSSWRHENIVDWLVKELKSKYDLPASTSTKWLKKKRLLPLLDGLDELNPELQESCVEALNQYLEGDRAPEYAVVCCRTEEYSLLKNKIKLNGGVQLKSLTNEQIQNYFVSCKKEYIWDEISNDNQLIALAQKPLMLSVMALTYQDILPEKWQKIQSVEDRQQILWDAYLLHRIQQNRSRVYGNDHIPISSNTKKWLTWLAKQLNTQSQDEFLIEQLQPSLLKKKHERLQYLLLTVAIRGLFLPLLFLLVSLLIFSHRIVLASVILGVKLVPILSFTSIRFFQLWVVGMAISVIIDFNSLDSIQTIEKLEFSFSKIKKRSSWKRVGDLINSGAFKGLVIGLIFSILVVISGDESNRANLEEFINFPLLNHNVLEVYISGAISGILMGSCVGFSNGILNIFRTKIIYRFSPREGLSRTLKNIPLILVITATMMSAIFFGMVLLQPKYLREQLSLPTTVGGLLVFSVFLLIFSLGLLPLVQHFSLRLVLFFSGYMPWNCTRFLTYCTELKFLQRVGGHYRFIHRQLQEHFAVMSLENPKINNN
jgi:adenylate kinase family enzyme/tetrahydromethanopterin S-methyltransferase subunit G